MKAAALILILCTIGAGLFLGSIAKATIQQHVQHVQTLSQGE